MGLPLNPLAVHLGAGTVQIYTQDTDSSSTVEYEVQCALALNGTYSSYSNNRFSGPDGWLYNMPLSNTIYMRIRAKNTDGTFSSWVQVKLGRAYKPQVLMQCRAIRGSIIPEGSMFTMKKARDRIVGFIADADIIFQ